METLFFFFIPGKYDPRNTSHRLKKKNKTGTVSLLFLVMQMHDTIHFKETKSIFSFHSKMPTFTNELEESLLEGKMLSVVHFLSHSTHSG